MCESGIFYKYQKSLQNLAKIIAFSLFILLLTSCTPDLHTRLSQDDKGNILYKGSYKVGQTYSQKGISYTPIKEEKYDKIGFASWYGAKHGFHGKKTANGDKYNKAMLTAAHPTLPMPSLVKVTNLKNNKSLVVMVNDRGPFAKNRLIDVSERAAEILDFKKQGVAKVRVEYLPKETHTLLAKFALKPVEGARSKKKAKDTSCSINCHIKLVNIQKKYHNFGG